MDKEGRDEGMKPRWPSFVNGALHAAGTGVIANDDDGFHLGLSVFETVACEDGRVPFLDEHLERLREGADVLSIAWPLPWDPEGALARVVDAIGGASAALRMTLSRGSATGGGNGSRTPTLVVTARPQVPWPEPGVLVVVSSYRKLGSDPLEALKSTNRLRFTLAREEAQGRGAWEALIPSEEGDLVEGCVSNLFCVSGGVLRTPAPGRGCLAGIVRGRLLSDLEGTGLVLAGVDVPVVVDRVESDHLCDASEIFLTNTTGRVIPVTGVMGADGSALAAGLPGSAGPVVRTLARRLAALEADSARIPRSATGS